MLPKLPSPFHRSHSFSHSTPSSFLSPTSFSPHAFRHLALTLQKLRLLLFGLELCTSALMRRSTISLFVVLLLFLLQSSDAKKKQKQEDKSSNSGKLRTKNGHHCTWETQDGKSNMVLHLSCTTSSGEAGPDAPDTYDCQFSGKPSECPAYHDKPAQYWKEVLGKLKKRENACEGGKVLKVRVCRTAPPSAHMKMIKDKKKAKNNEEMMMADEGVKGSYCGDSWYPLCDLLKKILAREKQ